MIAVSAELAAALAAVANQPLDLYELHLDSGVKYWSTEAITWAGQPYQAMVTGRSASIQNMGGEFNQVSVRVSNVSTAAAQALLGESIEGRRITIRKVDRTVTNDSVVVFSGVMQRISSIDREEAVVEAVELLGSIDDQFGRALQSSCSISEFKGPICRFAGAGSSCDRSWQQCSTYGNTESFFGIRFLDHQGVYQYVETQVKRFLLLFQRKKKTRKTASYSGVDDTPRGTAVPQVYGRTLLAAIPLYHEDQGGVTKGVSVFCGGPVDQIGYYRANEQLVAAVTEHQGQLGGLGNQTVDTRLANLYEFSGLAYITYDVPSAVEEVDPAPVITGLVKGRLVRSYNTSGVYQSLGWSDNPAFCSADFMMLEIDHGGMGVSESDINLQALGQTAAYCDGSIPDTTGDSKIYQPSSLPDGQTLGVEYRRYQPTGVIGHDPMADGPYAVYTPGSDDDTQTPASVNVKRFTCNVAIAEARSKVDILFDTLFPCFRGYRRYDKNGKIEILAEQANPFSTLSGAVSSGAVAVSVASTAGFQAGKFVVLGPHTANAETIAIQSVGSGVLNLDAPTANAHASGEEALQVEMRLDDSRLMGKIEYPLSGREASYNKVVCNYIDAPAGFEEIPLAVNDFLDQKLRRKTNTKEIDLTAVDSYFQAWRLGQTELAKSRDFAKWARVLGDISLSVLQVGDVVSLASSEHGLAAVPFRVEQKADEEDHSVTLLLRVYASGMYDDTAPRTTLQVPSVFAPILPGDVGLPDPPADVTDLALVSIGQDPDDPMLVRAEFEYTPPSPLGDFDGVEAQVERPLEAEASPITYAGPGQFDPIGWAASDGSDPSTFVVRLPFPKRAERWHVYAPSRSKFVTAPLVHRSEASPTPSLAVDVPENPQGFEPPNVTGVSIVRNQTTVVIRSRTAAANPKAVEYLRATWTLPTAHARYRELVYLWVELVRNATSEVVSAQSMFVDHANNKPTEHLFVNLPAPDPPEDFYVRVAAVNREGRPAASPPTSSLITLGTVAAAPAVVSPGVTVEYTLEGGVPKYRFVWTWTLPADPNEIFLRVDIDGKPSTASEYTNYAKEGGAATTQRSSWWERPAQSTTFNFRFVSVNTGEQRNEAAAVAVNVTVTALSASANATFWSPSVVSGVNEAGVETYGYQGTWTNPGDPNFDGVLIVGVFVGETVERQFTGVLRSGETSFATDQWPKPQTAFQIDLSVIAINKQGGRSAGYPTVRLTVSPGGTGQLKLNRAATATVGLGLAVSGGQLRVPDGGITNQLIGTVAAEKLIGALIQGLAFQLISGTQQMYINGTDGFRQYNTSNITEIRMKDGVLYGTYNGTEVFRLVGFLGSGFLEVGSLSSAAKAQVGAPGGVAQVALRNALSNVVVSIEANGSTLGQSGSGFLSIRNSTASVRVELGVDSSGNGQVRLNGSDYAMRAAAAGKKVVSGVAQFSFGQRTIASGLSSIESAVATPVSGGTPTEFIGSGTPSGGSVTFYNSNSSSSGFFSYVIVGTA